jgi:hypothetical protein
MEWRTFDTKNPFEKIIEFVSYALCLRLNARMMVRLNCPPYLVTWRHIHSSFVISQLCFKCCITRLYCHALFWYTIVKILYLPLRWFIPFGIQWHQKTSVLLSNTTLYCSNNQLHVSASNKAVIRQHLEITKIKLATVIIFQLRSQLVLSIKIDWYESIILS